MREPHALELREDLEEVPGQQVVRLRLLQPRVDPPGEVVVGVVAAEEHPVVEGAPVVVELVARVREPLAPPPAHGIQLRRRQRLAHEHVVVDGQGPQREPPQRPAERARAEHDAVGAHAPPLGAHDDGALLAVEAVTSVSSCTRTPSRSAAAARPQTSRAGSTRPTVGSRKPPRYRGESTRARACAASRRVTGCRGRVQLERLPHRRHLVVGERHRDLARHVEVGVDAVPDQGVGERGHVLGAEPLEGADLVRASRQPLREPVGQGRRRRNRRCAPTPRSRADRLQQHDVARRVVLLGLHRGPEPGEAAPDDDEVGAVPRPGERRARVGALRPVGPEDVGRRVGERCADGVGLGRHGPIMPWPRGARGTAAPLDPTASRCCATDSAAGSRHPPPFRRVRRCQDAAAPALPRRHHRAAGARTPAARGGPRRAARRRRSTPWRRWAVPRSACGR